VAVISLAGSCHRSELRQRGAGERPCPFGHIARGLSDKPRPLEVTSQTARDLSTGNPP
jgi:hypothetical protein